MASKGSIDYLKIASRALLGNRTHASGIATLNQYAERDHKQMMRRTATRPTGRQTGTMGGAGIWREIPRSGWGLFAGARQSAKCITPKLTVIAGYLFAYTPLKTWTTLSTLVGAFPGAVPPLIGWTAATASISLEGWILFAILFLWQFPALFSQSPGCIARAIPVRAF